MDPFVFFTDSMIMEFWNMSKILASSVSPMVMIGLATIFLSMFLPMAIGALRTAREKKSGKKQESDFEYREY